MRALFLSLFALAMVSNAAAAAISSEQAVSIAERTCGHFTKDLEKYPWHTKLENGQWSVWKEADGGTLLQAVDAKNGKAGECAFWGCAIPGLTSRTSCRTEKSN
jgi:hypothetical protein